MNIRFKGTDYEIPADVEAATTRKLENLAKYMRGKDGAADVYAELGRAVGGQQNGDIWRAELNVTVNGAGFRSEAKRETVEDAVDEAVAEMARSLRSAKRDEVREARSSGATLKAMLRGFWPK